MQKLILQFNLSKNTHQNAYESWARDEEIPAYLRDPSVDAYVVYRVRDWFIPNEEKPPFRYSAVISFSNIELFRAALQKEPLKSLQTTFLELTEDLVRVVQDPVVT